MRIRPYIFVLSFLIVAVGGTAWGQAVQPNPVVFQNPAAAAKANAASGAATTALSPIQKPVAVTPTAAVAEPVAETSEFRSDDDILGFRIAKVTRNLEKIPREHDQIWREYDISPYTKERNFQAGSRPEQTIIDWIIRQTGLKTWHSDVFSTLSADNEKLYVYHTKEVQMIVADVVDRFVTRQFANDSCKIRAVTLSRPDWVARNHQYLQPIPIVSPGVQGWILEKEGAQLLLQDLARRSDFKEIAQPQFLIPNGVAHNVSAKKPRTYLRDIQSNAASLNGYAEDRVTIEEGFGISFVPLALLDGQGIDAMITLDIVQVEKMIPMMIDAPTTTNPRQRVQVESPQVSCFKLDEQIRWPKNKVLLLDLGTIPMPENSTQTESQNFLGKLTKDLGKELGSVKRSNLLFFIENTTSVSTLPTPTLQPAAGAAPATTTTPAIGSNSGYWQGIR